MKYVSRFRSFESRTWVHLNSERREKGKHTLRALEAIVLGFEPNTSARSFFISSNSSLRDRHCGRRIKCSMTSTVFSIFCMRSIVDKFQTSGKSINIIYQAPAQVKWVPYNKLHVSNYEKVHYDTVSDVMVLQVNTCENTFV